MPFKGFTKPSSVVGWVGCPIGIKHLTENEDIVSSPERVINDRGGLKDTIRTISCGLVSGRTIKRPQRPLFDLLVKNLGL
jgi:hypothetical protein